MKIKHSEFFVVGNPWKNWVLVKLTTDDGLVGWGDATVGQSTKAVMGALEEIAPLIADRDPRQINSLWNELFKTFYLPANGIVLSAMAGIETACWDILGKSLNVPLHQLLGGKVRDEIRAYANGWYKSDRDPTAVAEKAIEATELGYTALKFDPFGSAYQLLDRSEQKLSLAIVEAVRDAVGDTVDILIEAHDRFTPKEATTIAHALHDFGIFWMEAPVPATDVDSISAVARSSAIRIAAGERFTTLRQFTELMAHGDVDIVQPEYIELGGLSRLRKVAAIAESFQGGVAPHNARAPLSTAVNVHFDLATPNAFIQECFEDFHVAWKNEIFEGIPSAKRGFLSVENAPGHGVSVNEEALSGYPYAHHHRLNLFQAGWEKRFDS